MSSLDKQHRTGYKVLVGLTQAAVTQRKEHFAIL